MQIILSLVAATALILGAVSLRPDSYGGDESLGATSFPTSLDTLTNPSGTDRVNSPSHADQHSNANDAIEALQAKVGVSSSSVQTSFDYKLAGVGTGDRACSLLGAESLSNKTLLSPSIATATIASSTLSSTTLTGNLRFNFGSDATGDLYYRGTNGLINRIALGSPGQFLQVSGGIPSWQTSAASAPTVTVNATSTASTTKKIITDGTSLITIDSYGSFAGDGTGGTLIVSLLLGSQSVDEFSISNPGTGMTGSFVTRYTGVPAAGTTTISVSVNKGSLQDTSIWVEDY